MSRNSLLGPGAYAPAIVFIDEIDAIGRTRTGAPGTGHGEEMALNALLTEMDGFTSPSVDRPVFVLAATNFNVKSEDPDHPERSFRSLDPALVRRFSRQILVDLPDRAARKRYFELRLGESKSARVSPATIDLLAEKSPGMSISHLEGVMETAARNAAQRGVELSDGILLEALDTAREGEAKAWSPQFLERTARHEAGHTLLYWVAGWWSPEVSIIARGDHGGGMRRNSEEMGLESRTRDELLAEVRTCLGGRAAEMVYYGREGGLSTGAAGDLQNATRLVSQMICRYGMDEEFGILATPELFQHAEALSSPIYQQVSNAAGRILKEQLDKTMSILQINRGYLDALVKALLEKNRLYQKDIEQILPAIAASGHSAGDLVTPDSGSDLPSSA